ncbi:MAG: ABC transporter ATP-binding protein [Burkholderiaceae bacterium]|nr:ABC transporter ATP-binding protein [Burkholderiaceae bacterium]
MSIGLEATDIVAGYKPDLPIVQGASVCIEPGEVVTIIGPNGAGKSTFLKAIAGFVEIASGELSLGGASIREKGTAERIQAGIGFVPQTGNVFTTLTVHENLLLGGYLVRQGLRQRLDDSYARFHPLAAHRNMPARVLSGGQRQMLAIARALMTDPRLLILDEPTAGLSPKAALEVFGDLRRLAGAGVAVLLVEQNAKAALRFSDRAYVFVDGQVRKHGVAIDFLDDPDIGAAFLGARQVTP